MSEKNKKNQQYILEHLKDLPLKLDVILAEEEKTLQEMLYAVPGAVISFKKKVGKDAFLSLNGKKLAEGQVVSSKQHYGLKISKVCTGDKGG